MDSYFDETERRELEGALSEAVDMMSGQLPVCCGECFYFVDRIGDVSCHRHSPTVVVFGDGDVETVYPSVGSDYVGCGDGVRASRRISSDDVGRG